MQTRGVEGPVGNFPAIRDPSFAAGCVPQSVANHVGTVYSLPQLFFSLGATADQWPCL